MIRFLLVIFLPLLSLSAMLKEQAIPESLAPSTKDIILSLGRDDKQEQIYCKNMMDHIRRFRLDKNGSIGLPKIIGLHHYTPRTVRVIEKGTVIEISNTLWIYSEENIEDFHTGYVILEGVAYDDQPKGFFPTKWSVTEIENYIRLVAKEGKPVWHPKNTDFCEVSAVVTGDPLRFVIQKYTDQFVLKTVYPTRDYNEVKRSVLDALAQEQAEKLKQLKRERLACMVARAQRQAQTPKKIENTDCSELFEVVQKGDRTKLEALVSAGIDINVKDSHSKTALMVAAAHGNADMVVDLLSSGANPADRDKNGKSVLEYALSSLEEYVLIPLLGSLPVAEINQHNNEGVTPLISVIRQLKEKRPRARWSVFDIVDLLLTFGADPQMADRNGITPLMHCVQLQHNVVEEAKAVISLLVVRGTDPDVQKGGTGKSAGATALMYAVEYHQPLLVEHLLKCLADYTLVNKKKRTAQIIAHNRDKQCEQALASFIQAKEAWIKEHNANELIYAAHKNNLLRVRKLLQTRTCPVNYVGYKGDSALYYSILYANNDMVKLLLEADADPRIECSGGKLLDYALSLKELSDDVKEQLTDRVNELNAPETERAHQRDVRKQRGIEKFKEELSTGELTPSTVEFLKTLKPRLIDGECPLLHAIRAKKAKAVATLAKHKECYEDEKNDLVEIAYRAATEANQLDVLKALVLSSAVKEAALHALLKRHLLTKKGLDALRWHKAIVNLLKGIPHFYCGFYKMLIQENATECTHRLCEFDPELLTADEAGSCLCQAIQAGRYDMARHLLELYPLASHYCDEEGRTPVMHAAQQRMVDLFEALSRSGSDLHAQDLKKRTVKDYIQLNTPVGQQLVAIYDRFMNEPDKAHEESGPIQKEWTQAMIAAYKENLDELAAATKEDINKPGPEGLTPLHIAALYNKNRSLQQLLSRKDVELNSADLQGRTPLICAAQKNNKNVVEKLLQKGASALLFDAKGNTLYHYVRKKHAELRTHILQCMIEEVCESKQAAHFEKFCSFFDRLDLDADSRESICYILILCPSSAPILELLVSRKKELIKSLRALLVQLSQALCSSTLIAVCQKWVSYVTDQNVVASFSVLGQHLQPPTEIHNYNHCFLDAAYEKFQTFLKLDILDPDVLLFAAISQNHTALINMLLYMYPRRSWELKNFSMPKCFEVIAFAPHMSSFRSYITRGGSILITPVIWAWLLDNREMLEMLMKVMPQDLIRLLPPENIPIWLILYYSYESCEDILRALFSWAKNFQARSKMDVYKALQTCYEELCPGAIVYLHTSQINLDVNAVPGEPILMRALQSFTRTDRQSCFFSGAPQHIIDEARLNVIKALISCGADVTKSANGVSPFAFALRNNLQSIALQIFVQPGYNIPIGVLDSVVLAKFMRVGDILQMMKAKPHLFQHATILLGAAVADNHGLIQVLLRNEAVTPDHVGSAFCLMCRSVKDKRLIKKELLASRKFDPNKLYTFEHAPSGVTLLMAAADGDEVAVTMILRLPGINTQTKNQDGQTARDIAVRRNQQAVVKLLDEFDQQGVKALIPYEKKVIASYLKEELPQLLEKKLLFGKHALNVIEKAVDKFVDTFNDSQDYLEQWDNGLRSCIRELLSKDARYIFEIFHDESTRVDVRKAFVFWLLADFERQNVPMHCSACRRLAALFVGERKKPLFKKNPLLARTYLGQSSQHLQGDDFEQSGLLFGTCYQEEGNHEKALTLFIPLFKKEGFIGNFARVLAARSCLYGDTTRNLAAAEQYLLPLVSQTSPTDIRAQALYLLGEKNRIQGNFEEAKKYYEEACALGDVETRSLVSAALASISKI